MKTILVVDDFASVRFYHQSLLRSAGFQTATAADGAEALGFLEKGPVDLIVLDLMMPKMSGGEFIAQVRGHPRYGQIPILIITSENERESAKALLGQGRCALLHKPILPESFLRGVRQLMS